MTRSNLNARMARRSPQLTAKDAEIAINAIFDAMISSLASGQRIEIRGFGSFDINHRPPRTARNPKTGEKVAVPEKFVLQFKAGKALKARVDR